jgi:hypothetical protein
MTFAGCNYFVGLAKRFTADDWLESIIAADPHPRRISDVFLTQFERLPVEDVRTHVFGVCKNIEDDGTTPSFAMFSRKPSGIQRVGKLYRKTVDLRCNASIFRGLPRFLRRDQEPTLRGP